MAIDLSTLSNQMVTAQAIGNLVLAWPQKNVGITPQSPLFNDPDRNKEKFLFHYEAENTVTLTSEITDNYIEDNSAVQDHISLAPELIVTNGFIGELNNVVPEELELLKTAAEKLTVISAYEPVLSISGITAYNRALQIYRAAQLAKQASTQKFASLGQKKTATVINSGQSAQDFAASIDFNTQNAQQVAFQKFYGYRKARMLFTVQTPWAIFEDCAIQELVATQAEDTKLISNFQITFKPLRYASTIITSAGSEEDFEPRAWNQNAPDQGASVLGVEYNDYFQTLPGGSSV